MDELDARLEGVYAATTRAQLRDLIADLPRADAPACPWDNAPAADVGSRAPQGDVARAAHGAIRPVLRVYLLLSAFLVTIWLLTTPGGYFWPVWPMLGWGFVLSIYVLIRSVIRGERPAVNGY